MLMPSPVLKWWQLQWQLSHYRRWCSLTAATSAASGLVWPGSAVGARSSSVRVTGIQRHTTARLIIKPRAARRLPGQTLWSGLPRSLRYELCRLCHLRTIWKTKSWRCCKCIMLSFQGWSVSMITANLWSHSPYNWALGSLQSYIEHGLVVAGECFTLVLRPCTVHSIAS